MSYNCNTNVQFYITQGGILMILVSVQNLTPGMRVGVDIYNLQNQLVLPKDTVLTQDIIDKLKDHSIHYVKVYEDEHKVSDFESTPSHSECIKSSRAFQEFKEEFINTVYIIKDEFNDVVTKHIPINVDKLLERTATVFFKANGTNIFDMLHNMREYDDSTYVHCLNVSLICGMLAKWLNFSKDDTDILILAGMLHDIGKLCVPDTIIKKPEKLSDEEYTIVKTHTTKGYEILAPQDLPDEVKYAALMHHERCDGTGYPKQLKLEKIDRFARLVSIADVYDAMTSARVYRGPMSPFAVVDTFEQEGLYKYDPECILIFLENIVNTFLENRVLLSDGRKGEIVLINKQALSKPLIQLEDGFLDLAKHKDISIDKII